MQRISSEKNSKVESEKRKKVNKNNGKVKTNQRIKKKGKHVKTQKIIYFLLYLFKNN